MVRHGRDATAQIATVGRTADVKDFDPALAIGTADEFIARPMPESVRYFRTRKCEPKGFRDKRAVSVDADFEACAAQSPLLMATDRALRLRTPEARRAVLELMGKGT